MKKIILDLDEVLELIDYGMDQEVQLLSTQVDAYRSYGFEVVLSSSVTGVRRSEAIEEPQRPLADLAQRLHAAPIQFDDVVFGKPFDHRNALVLDDKSVTHEEFMRLSYEQIAELLMNELKEGQR